VDDEGDVGLGAKGGDVGGIVGGGVGLDDGDAEGAIAMEDARAGGAGKGLGDSGEGAIVEGDEVAVGNGSADGAGEILRGGVERAEQ
jgi:hypothetical protein